VDKEKRDTFELLYKTHYKELYIHALSFVRDEEEAKDIVTDVYEYVWKNFEKLDSSVSLRPFLYSLVMDTYSFGYSSSGFTDMPMNHKVFLAQFDAIKKLASEGPCVMVGRCADYALSEYKDCFSVFVHADTDWRINRLSQKHNKTAKEAKDMINKTDKSRSSYYNYYTNKKWGAASSYNLCVDSSKLGIDGAAKAIIQAIEIFDSIKNK